MYVRVIKCFLRARGVWLRRSGTVRNRWLMKNCFTSRRDAAWTAASPILTDKPRFSSLEIRETSSMPLIRAIKKWNFLHEILNIPHPVLPCSILIRDHGGWPLVHVPWELRVVQRFFAVTGRKNRFLFILRLSETTYRCSLLEFRKTNYAFSFSIFFCFYRG